MPGRFPWSQWSVDKQLLFTVALAVVIALVLDGLAVRPQPRLERLYILGILFFLLVLLRYALRRAPEQPQPLQASDSRNELWLALGWGMALYALVFGVYFVADDFSLLFGFQSWSPAQTIWHHFTKGMVAAGYFRPLWWTSLLLDYWIWGPWPPGYHLTAIVLYSAAVAGVYCLGTNLGLDRRTSGTAALVFSVLPIHVEPLAWIADRHDLLATAFMIWALVFYSRFRTQGHRASYAAAGVCFLLALLSKESAFVLPLLLLAMEGLVLPQRRLKATVPFFVLAGIVFTYRLAILGRIGGPGSGEGSYVLTVGFRTFWGVFAWGPVQTLLGYNSLQPPPEAAIVLAATTAALLLLLAVAAKPKLTRRKWIWFSLAWVVLCMLPVHFNLRLPPGLFGARWFYLSSVGLAFLLALLLAGLERTSVRRLWTCLLAAVLGLGLAHNLRAWHRAGELSQIFVTELKQLEPSPPPNALFVFHDMPDTIRGINYFRTNLARAVNQAYGRRDLNAVRAPELSSPLPDSLPEKPVIRLRWTGETPPLLQRLRE